MGSLMMSREDLLSRREVAALLGVSVETIKGWARKGVGPEFSRSGPVRGRVWYQAADVVAWLEAQKRRRAIQGEAPSAIPYPHWVGVVGHVGLPAKPDCLSGEAVRGGRDEKAAGVFHAAKEAQK
jgi:predicted DNA-binding transcriptional regulator AlpA